MPKKSTKITLGMGVKDQITGFEGIAIGRTEWLHGCDRIEIESKNLKDGKPVGSETFDITRLVIDPKIKPIKFKELKRPTVKLGQKVKDTITGYEGIAGGITQTINGWYIQITADRLKSDKTLYEGLWFNAKRIEVIKKTPVKKSGSEKTRKTGGPQDDMKSKDLM